MKWKGMRKSSNIDDRRGQNSGNRTTNGGLGKSLSPMLISFILKFLFTKKGLIIVGIVLAISFFTGTNPISFISNFLSGNSTQTTVPNNYTGTAKQNELADFSATILANTEDIWKGILPNYREPTLVLFTNSVSSACGSASSATGPFYCPGDEKLYIDLSFFEEMGTKFNAPGDFAQAYVIAHEVGHHIQNLMGTTDKMQQLRARISKTEYNKLSVKLELQADFLAGVWAHHSQKINKKMEAGDLQEALDAAFATGDDLLQEKYSGRVVPDSFTHGTSAQRMRWFQLGFNTGDITKGDTFNASSL